MTDTPKAKPRPKVDAEDVPADDADVVAVVSRNEDGSPAQRDGFVLLLPEDPADDELVAAWNDSGNKPPADQRVRYFPRG